MGRFVPFFLSLSILFEHIPYLLLPESHFVNNLGKPV